MDERTVLFMDCDCGDPCHSMQFILNPDPMNTMGEERSPVTRVRTADPNKVSYQDPKTGVETRVCVVNLDSEKKDANAVPKA